MMKTLVCARFGEFWLFFTKHVFTLPLLCEKNQGAQNFTHKSEKRAHPCNLIKILIEPVCTKD